MSTTNETKKYLMRTLPLQTDLLSDNYKISNAVLNSVDNTLTITTLLEHKIKIGKGEESFVFLDNLYYKEPIENFRSLNATALTQYQDYYYEIKLNYGSVNFNNLSLIKLRDLSSDNSLNKDFVIIKFDIKVENEIEKLYIYGYFTDFSKININIQNQGIICYKFNDEIFIKPSSQSVDFYNTTSFLGGCYNGLKVVLEIIDDFTFKVKLHNNNNLIVPQYKDIYFLDGVARTEIKINTSLDLTSENIMHIVNQFKENKNQGHLIITRSGTDITEGGLNVDGLNNSLGAGVQNYFAQQNMNYIATLFFRVKRDSEDQYILGEEANDIAEDFEKKIGSLVNSLFFAYELNYYNILKIEELYQSVFSSTGKVEKINSVENAVFYKVEYSFKISKYVSNYNKYITNSVGVPIRETNIDIKNNIDVVKVIYE